MNDEKESIEVPNKTATDKPGGGMTKEEVTLELTRFIAVTTGLGKSASGAGFSGKTSKTPEEQADALIALYRRCREVVNQG